MKKEDLFEGFGTLDDDLLIRSEKGGNTVKKRRNISRMISYGSIAACLVIAVGVGVLFMDNKSFEQDIDQIGNIIAEENDNATAGERNDIQEKPESYVDVSMLLASNEGVEKQVLEFACLRLKKS